jgi:hypothetical protein
MDAVISGQLGRAFILDGEKCFVMTAANPAELEPVPIETFRVFHQEAQDLEYLEDIGQDAVRQELQRAEEVNEMLTALSIVMDASFSNRVRRMAVETLGKTLAHSSSDLSKCIESVLSDDQELPSQDNAEIVRNSEEKTGIRSSFEFRILVSILLKDKPKLEFLEDRTVLSSPEEMLSSFFSYSEQE